MVHIRANDDACAEWHRKLKDEFAAKGFYHSIELPDGRVLEGILKIDRLKERLASFPIPHDLKGKRVLDIGTWDGYFAFEMEKRGAEVMAIDNVEVENFYRARELLGSRVEYHVMDVYELSPERVGRFDFVLFLGVLYHLKHPLLALEAVCSVTQEMALIESFVTNDAIVYQNGKTDMPAMEFYETNELLGEVDNWVGPNLQCLLAFCRTAGFARPVLQEVKQQRALVACYRQWEPEPDQPGEDAPRLNAAVHTSNYGINFGAKEDVYVSSFFKSSAANLNLDTVMPEVSGYGVRPVAVVHHGGDGWQANFRLPPGLAPGWHDVRVRTARTRYSNPARIAVDMPARTEGLTITGACDGKTWKPWEAETFLSIWVAGLPANADRNNVQVRLAGSRLAIQELMPAQGSEPRQLNVRIESPLPSGEQQLVVCLGQAQSPPVIIRVKEPR